MIPEKYRILMNSELDGTSTPDERDELELYFVRHPEARQYFAELKESLRTLDAWPEVDPPAGLHGRIMRAVRRREAEKKRRLTWSEFLFIRLRLGYALSAVVGVMVGVLLHALIPVDGMSRDLTNLDYYNGTSSLEAMRDSGWVAAPAADLSAEGVQGQVHAFRLQDKVLVRLTLRAARDVKLGIAFEPRARLQGIIYGENEGFTTATGSGSVQLAGSGRCRCEFLVDNLEDADLSLDIAPTEGGGSLDAKRIRWR